MPERTIEAIGANVDAAIENGLARLGVGRDAVEVEVLDQGSRGLLGLGTREARVRLTLNEPGQTPEPTTVYPGAYTTDEDVSDIDPDLPPAEVTPVAQGPVDLSDGPVEFDYIDELELAEFEPVETEEDEGVEFGDHERDVEVALDKLRGILERLAFEDAETAVVLSDPDPRTERQLPIIRVSGDEDLGMLVGSGGSTLRSLQYVIRLMVGHELHQRSNVIIDVGGYRDQRQQALTKLAERMAQKAIERGRPVTLEPMPPNERRLIHLALHDHEKVYTESAGEGEQRRVRIYLKDR